MFTIYTAKNCHECEAVEKEVRKLELKASFINVDLKEGEPPIPIFAYPALFRDKILIAYGSDIVRYLSAKV